MMPKFAKLRRSLISSRKRRKLPYYLQSIDHDETVRGACYRYMLRYVAILNDANVSYIFVGPHAMAHLASHRCAMNCDFWMLVHNPAQVALVLQHAGLRRSVLLRPGIEGEDWTVRHGPAYDLPFGSHELGPFAPCVVLLNAKEWSLEPIEPCGGPPSAHMPSFPQVVLSLLSILLAKKESTDLWKYAMDCASTLYSDKPFMAQACQPSLIPSSHRQLHFELCSRPVLPEHKIELSRSDIRRYALIRDILLHTGRNRVSEHEMGDMATSLQQADARSEELRQQLHDPTPDRPSRRSRERYDVPPLPTLFDDSEVVAAVAEAVGEPTDTLRTWITNAYWSETHTRPLRRIAVEYMPAQTESAEELESDASVDEPLFAHRDPVLLPEQSQREICACVQCRRNDYY